MYIFALLKITYIQNVNIHCAQRQKYEEKSTKYECTRAIKCRGLVNKNQSLRISSFAFTQNQGINELKRLAVCDTGS